MGFLRAKHGLSKHGLKRPKFGLQRAKRTNCEGRRGEEEEEEKKRKKEDLSQDQAKVWNFGFLVWKPTLIMDSMRFGMYLWVCMMIILLKPRVLLGFHLNPKIKESRVGKTPYGTR